MKHVGITENDNEQVTIECEGCSLMEALGMSEALHLHYRTTTINCLCAARKKALATEQKEEQP
jgi:hypothetical protein